jgi:hypothetical protein
MARNQKLYAAPESSSGLNSKGKATPSKETTPDANTKKSSQPIFPDNWVDKTSEALGTTFAIVGYRDSKRDTKE